MKIAIQGYPGAFHEVAVRHFMADQPVEIVPADTFSDVVEYAESGVKADRAFMAIENTIAGTLLSNYQLLNNSSLQITGEIYLRIKQNLLVLEGQKIEDLREVHSHPIAIAQCRKFFSQYPHIKLIETLDTALSAKHVRDKQLKDVGAIASSLAAKTYDLDVLAASIETNKQNYTRFLVLENVNEIAPLEESKNKISVSFSVSHEVGSLHQVLAGFAYNGANLTKIQSTPIIGKPWEYRFFVDFELKHPNFLEQTVANIRPFVSELKILGKYEKGKHYED